MATTTHQSGRRIALGEIRVPENVRALDPGHVKALAGSIKLQGMLVPVVVRDDGERLRAGRRLSPDRRRAVAGLADVPAVVRDVETEDADRAVENIARKQLNPYEEAQGGPRDARPRAERGRRRAGARLAQGA